jgi:hypothetical protein
VSSALKSNPAWDKKEPGAGLRDKERLSARKEKKINVAAFVLFKLFSAQTQTHNNSFRPSPRPGELPSPFNFTTAGTELACAGNFSG